MRSEVSAQFEGKRVLVVGVGGLGCAALAALSRSSIGTFVLVDDDTVDETNLHRQVLFNEADVGRPKLRAAADALVARGVGAARIELCAGRVVPDTARGWFREVDLVLEGADNYATKFLVADAGYLEHKPVVHGAAVGWHSTVLAVPAEGKPCYRCLFEDLPRLPGGSCDSTGVMGPVVGAAGALMADQALRLLSDEPAGGTIHTLDGRSGRLRSVGVRARPNCPLCGAQPTLRDVVWESYTGATCAPDAPPSG